MAISAIEPESNWIKNRDCFLVFEISINRFYYMIFVHKIHDINLLTATLQYSIQLHYSLQSSSLVRYLIKMQFLWKINSFLGVFHSFQFLPNCEFRCVICIGCLVCLGIGNAIQWTLFNDIGKRNAFTARNSIFAAQTKHITYV